MKRLNCLRGSSYQKQIIPRNVETITDDMLQKSYARKSRNEQVGKVWYISSHGVTHPAKPAKVRVVLGSNAEFVGTSLNQQLIAGPDITNQLVGVLTRLREDYIAYMTDIEAMRFLCWRWHGISMVGTW